MILLISFGMFVSNGYCKIIKNRGKRIVKMGRNRRGRGRRGRGRGVGGVSKGGGRGGEKEGKGREAKLLSK